MNRNRNQLLIFTFTLSIVFFSSCRDIIEPSIVKREVQLQAPAKSYTSTSYNVNFWWNEVEDALRYRLQIVGSAFDSPDALVLDTMIRSNKCSFTLSPGQYQWRIRAENGSTQTAYSSPRSLQIAFSSIK